ncbi:MAG: type IV pilus assembly protein PilM [Planctomycetota bacterium]|nr:type IV pilus assembly protein PilM [Planctomycetota bacterium]
MADFVEVWCIDSGKTSLKALKIQRSGSGAEILQAEKIDHPSGAGAEAMMVAISSLAARYDLSDALVVALPSRSALTSFIPIPPVDGKKLDELIGYEAQQNIPLPIDEVIWGSHVSGDTEEGEKEVGIFAVRSDEVSDILVDFSQEGHEIDVLTLGNVGLLNLIRFDLRPTRPVVALEIGSDHTDLIIVNGPRFWFRSLPIAGKDFTSALQEKFGCTQEEAENLKVTAARSEHAAKIFQVLQPLLRDLVSEINRSIGYYKSRVGEVKVEDLFLFGGSSKLVGLRKFLEENLRIRVQMAKSLNRVRISAEASSSGIQQDLPSFSSAIGAGLQALGLGEVDLNLLPQEKQDEVEFRKKQKTVLAAAASLYLLIVFLIFNFGGKIDRAEEVLASTDKVSQLNRNKSRLSDLAEQQTEVVSRQTELISRGEGRLAPREIMEMLPLIVSSETQAQRESVRVEDGPELDSMSGQVEADMEVLNSQKTWLSGLDIKQVRVDEYGTVIDDARKVDSGIKVFDDRYLVVIQGFRYDQGDAQSNDQKLKDLIVTPVEDALASKYGPADASGSRVTREVGQETMLMWSDHESFKGGGRRNRGVEEQDHGVTLYPWTIRWIHPPLPSQDQVDGDGDEG